MSSTVTVSIGRTSLSLSALVIADDGTTYQIGDGGLGDPDAVWRTTSMPDSQDVHGSELVSAVLEQTSIPLSVIVKGSSMADLKTKRDALKAALSQFTYPVTVTVGGSAEVWDASPANWSFGVVGPGNVAQFFQVATITIPVYPISS